MEKSQNNQTFKHTEIKMVYLKTVSRTSWYYAEDLEMLVCLKLNKRILQTFADSHGTT